MSRSCRKGLLSQKSLGTAFVFLIFEIFIASCALENPAEKIDKPSELSYNYWLLESLYFFENLPENSEFETPEALYASLADPYTRYVVPEKAPDAEIGSTTSIVPGSIGVEIGKVQTEEFPLFLSRVYKNAPASNAGVPRYAQLISINETLLSGDSAAAQFSKTLAAADSVYLKYVFDGDTLNAAMKKEIVYAPTVFLDTLVSGIPWITLRRFSEKTADSVNGSWGELNEILKEISESQASIVGIDLSSNPGGLISQCSQAADLFIVGNYGSSSVKNGNKMVATNDDEKSAEIFRVKEKAFFSDGQSKMREIVYNASEFAPGKNLKLLLFTSERTASCAEIFVMALLQNNTNAHTIGKTTFGKGIGQTMQKTPAGGLAYITSMMIFDKNGDSYHGKGIEAEYPCDNLNNSCVTEAISFYGGKAAFKQQLNQNTIHKKETKSNLMTFNPFGTFEAESVADGVENIYGNLGGAFIQIEALQSDPFDLLF